MSHFDAHFERLVAMKKADIIREGQTWGIWATYNSTTAELLKWKKVLLARMLADRLDRLENLGY